mgnify:CR=1 FL=1
MKDFFGGVTREIRVFGLIFLGFLGCGESSTSATFQLDYSEVSGLLSNGKLTTVRLGYTYTGFTRNNQQQIKVYPSAAIPTVISTEGDVQNYEWSTASDAGVSLVDSSITLDGVPLGKRGTDIFLEVLQKFPDDQWYVVAYFCYEGPRDEELTEAQLKADTTVEQVVFEGRTCGQCSKQQKTTNHQANCPS